MVDEADEDDDQKYVCHLCVNEDYLSNLIYKEGIEKTCDYCGENESAITIEELADHIEGAFDRHFYRTSDQPDGFEHAMLADRESSYEWERHGEPVLEAIGGAAEIDEQIAQDVLEILEERHADYESAKMGEECEFDCESYYDSKGADDIEFQMDWRFIENELKTKSRYFNRTAEAFFDRLFGKLDSLATHDGTPVIVHAGPERELKSFYRARVFHNTPDLERALARPDLELGPPPARFARAGRMNAQGIAVFYGASDPDTALAEVRPPVGSRVLVGRFLLSNEVRLLDVQALRTLYVEGSYFDPEYLSQLEMAKFLGSLSARMTMPVMPDDEPTEYLVTQMIADYLSRTPSPGFDGMLFPSVQKEGERANVVLFNHASRVAEWQIPEGTEIDSTIYPDEDETTYYHVTEKLPPKTEKAEKDPDPFGFSFAQISIRHYGPSEDREVTLALDPASLQVHHIQSVSFGTAVHDVTRNRREKGKLPF